MSTMNYFLTGLPKGPTLAVASRFASSESKGGWLKAAFAPSDARNKPHSRLLASSEFIYEMHHHNVIPATSGNYVKKYKQYFRELEEKTNRTAELVGSFRVEIGNQDEYIHIWRYHDGWKRASDIHEIIRTDDKLVNINNDISKDLFRRENQLMTSFSFWDHPKLQPHDAFYEMRSYVLRPGTMIEWANAWSNGIKHRDNGVAGFFTQIGQLYQVHHIWQYKNFQDRKDVRENAWRKPGWDECVAITVPNIVKLNTRWLKPVDLSPGSE